MTLFLSTMWAQQHRFVEDMHRFVEEWLALGYDAIEHRSHARFCISRSWRRTRESHQQIAGKGCVSGAGPAAVSS